MDAESKFTESEVTEKESTTVEIYNAFCISPHLLKPWETFIYIDCPQYLADNIFEKHRIRPWFGKEQFNADGKYLGIVCRIRKRRLDAFLVAMEELQRKMLICGYNDYETFCRDVRSALMEDNDNE